MQNWVRYLQFSENVSKQEIFVRAFCSDIGCKLGIENGVWEVAIMGLFKTQFIAEPLGLATQGNFDLRSFCYMYKQRFSHPTLVIANRRKVGKTGK
jgi:hypothetical protein